MSKNRNKSNCVIFSSCDEGNIIQAIRIYRPKPNAMGVITIYTRDPIATPFGRLLRDKLLEEISDDPAVKDWKNHPWKYELYSWFKSENDANLPIRFAFKSSEVHDLAHKNEPPPLKKFLHFHMVIDKFDDRCMQKFLSVLNDYSDLGNSTALTELSRWFRYTTRWGCWLSGGNFHTELNNKPLLTQNSLNKLQKSVAHVFGVDFSMANTEQSVQPSSLTSLPSTSHYIFVDENNPHPEDTYPNLCHPLVEQIDRVDAAREQRAPIKLLSGSMPIILFGVAWLARRMQGNDQPANPHRRQQLR